MEKATYPNIIPQIFWPNSLHSHSVIPSGQLSAVHHPLKVLRSTWSSPFPLFAMLHHLTLQPFERVAPPPRNVHLSGEEGGPSICLSKPLPHCTGTPAVTLRASLRRGGGSVQRLVKSILLNGLPRLHAMCIAPARRGVRPFVCQHTTALHGLPRLHATRIAPARRWVRPTVSQAPFI